MRSHTRKNHRECISCRRNDGVKIWPGCSHVVPRLDVLANLLPQPTQAEILAAAHAIRDGGVIAYPTEAVYGLGCDPQNPDSVFRLLGLKQRDPKKGLILIASDMEQLSAYVKPIPPERMSAVTSTWPGPVTWLFPAADNTPWWLTGGRETLAVRVTAHPVAAAICKACAGPIVSTSANLSGREPARSGLSVHEQFGDSIDLIVPGSTDAAAQPTPIFNAITDEQIRI